MKEVYRTQSLEEANEIKSRLESAGIPVMISNEHFSALRIPLFPNNLGVFIYLDEQYNDACRVLTDTDYSPDSAVDIEQFYQLLESDEFKHSVNSGYLIILAWTVSLMLIAMLVLFFLYRTF
ncbi:MAG: DUF2007 domain-containing protein [Gammaproteobacteria bacterium]|jgi:hypothetical protein